MNYSLCETMIPFFVGDKFRFVKGNTAGDKSMQIYLAQFLLQEERRKGKPRYDGGKASSSLVAVWTQTMAWHGFM